MKRAIFFISAIIIISSFSSQLLALPEGAVARLGKGSVGEVTFSPDGKILAVAGSIGVWLYDSVTFAEIGLLEIDAGVSSVAFSPDGSMLASGSGDATIKLWDVKSRSLITTLEGHTRQVYSVAFSPDGNMLASGGTKKGEGGGDYIGEIKLWDMKSRSIITTLEVHEGYYVYSVAFSPDGNMLASGGTCMGEGDWGAIKLWDVKSRSPITTLDGDIIKVYSVVFSPDGNMLASGGADDTIKLWDMKSRSLITTLEGHKNGVRSVAFSPDGSILASGGDDYTVKLWDVKSRSIITTLKGPGDVYSVAFSPDDNMLASSGYDEINLWDVKSRSIITTFFVGPLTYVESVVFSPDGSLLASGGSDGTVKLWDVRSRTLTATLESPWVYSVAFNPDGSLLASGGGLLGTVKLWDVRSRTLVATLENSYDVTSVAFSPDGSLLASGSYDHTVKLWDVKSRSLISTLSGHSSYVFSVAFSPDGSLLASGGRDKIKLWNVNSRSLIATLSGDTLQVQSVAFSPDGSILASGGDDYTVKLWDVKSRSLISTLEGHTLQVHSVSFCPDGSMLASGSWDCMIILWDMKPYIQKSTEDIPKLKEITNAKLSQRPIYPPYLLDTDSFLSAVNTIWQNFTDWFRRNDLTDNYEELYYTGIDYDNMRFSALIKARDFLDKWDVANAKRFLDKADTYEKMSIISFQGASYVFEANLEVAKTIAQSIKDGCQASVKFGLQVANPTAAEVADYIYDLTDLGIEYYIGDKEQAVKDFLLKQAVNIVFDKLGDQTMSDWAKSRTDKYLFSQLNKFIKSEEWQQALSKVIKEGVSSISEEALTQIVKFTVNETDKMMNYLDAKLHSPAEIRVYDSQGRITGIVNGKVKNEIPGSVYDNEMVTIFFPTEAYKYEVAGKDKGEYGLEVTLTKDANPIVFNATEIPTSANAVHYYSINWDVLSTGGEGVAINKDSNGDGKFEETINTGANFTEYNCDVNSDGVVNILDLVIVSKYFGKSKPDNAKADVNKDGVVDVLDLNIVIQHFGK